MSDEGIKEVTCERREPKNPGSDVTRSFTLSALYPFASQTGTGRETGPGVGCAAMDEGRV